MNTNLNTSQPTCKITENGSEWWWLDGKLHREDGPARLHVTGEYVWWLNGEMHRVGGPAVKSISVEWYYFKGQKHRVDGPAYITYDGKIAWYLYDTYYSTFTKWLKHTPLDEEQKLMLKLMYG